ncbi:MAG: hypothetical protein WAU08_15190 [Flavobacteriales bacterium]|jgi:hypothetical protein
MELIHANLGLWGGRYNPIIPVEGDKEPVDYLDMLKYYDPDHVYYTKSVGEHIAKGVVGGNACKYEQLDTERPGRNVEGLNIHYLLSKYNHNHVLILNESIKGRDWPLADYYRINFGFGDSLLYYEELLCAEYSSHGVNNSNVKVLSQLILQDGYLTRSDLSRSGRTSPKFRPKQGRTSDTVEIIIAKDETTTIDLLYHWNRTQFDTGQSLFCTLEQFKSLIQDPCFFRLLERMCQGRSISLVSSTLTNAELSELISTDLAAVKRAVMFHAGTSPLFPFEIDPNHTTWFRDGEPVQVHTMVSEEGIYYPPKLSFTDAVTDNSQHWVVDVSIDRAVSGTRHQMRFPRTENCQSLFSVQGVRVNHTRNMSLVMWSQRAGKETMTLRIPPFELRLNQMLTRPFYQGAEHQNGYETVRRSDDSNRLSGFFGLFHGHFSTMETFFHDKFWVGVFEECCKSERAVGDTIEFAYLLELCIAIMKDQGISFDDQEHPYHNMANLKEGLMQTLEELCNYRVFLKGYALKCPTCASRFWYHLSEFGETYECKGCLAKNDIPVESKMAYKLNELVRKNILQRQVEPKGKVWYKWDGNWTVVRTLLRLWSRDMSSFEYSPQMELYRNFHDSKPAGDLDILCISKGELIIGEAKQSSDLFAADNRKSLNSLIEVAKVVNPDHVVLSCSTNKANRLTKEVAYVERALKSMSRVPKVEGIVLSEPDYGAFVGPMYFPN